MALSILEKAKYLAWAATHDSDHKCPGCASGATALVRRKYLVTALYECTECGLRFRTPKGSPKESDAFYQQAYSQGFTTDCPSDKTLAELVANSFRGTERDFTTYIQILRDLGLQAGDSVLDFGSSWGYGSWQLSRAGYDVLSYEVSQPRADYSRVKLGCRCVSSIQEVPRIRCFFTAHVIEHLDNPNLVWEIAKAVLNTGGFIACFCPNGNPDLEGRYGTTRYDLRWGKVHPLVITPRFIESTCTRHGFSVSVSTSPYTSLDDLMGDELCMIARPT